MNALKSPGDIMIIIYDLALPSDEEVGLTKLPYRSTSY